MDVMTALLPNRPAISFALPFVILSASAAWGGLYETNLLGNPGFEDYYTAAGVEWQGGSSIQYGLQLDNTTDRGAQPWASASSRVASIRTDGPGTGASGGHFGTGGRFVGGTGEQAIIRQDIDLLAVGFNPFALDAGEVVFEAGAYLSSYSGDEDSVGFSVAFLDGADALRHRSAGSRCVDVVCVGRLGCSVRHAVRTIRGRFHQGGWHQQRWVD